VSEEPAAAERATDGGDAEQRQAHTIRLELVDEPGELLNALRPIADNGGNLLSVFHERGSLTPRGRIPVEVDLECTSHQLDVIVDALREAGVNVVRAGTERYGVELSVLLVGPLVESDLSDTLSRIDDCASASVVDFSLTDGTGDGGVGSARLRIAAVEGSVGDALGAVRAVADEKDLRVVEPLVGGEA